MVARRYTRRGVLKMLGLGAAGAMLAACTQPAAPTKAPGPTEAPAEPTTAPVAEPTALPPTEAAKEAVKVTLWSYPDDDIYFNDCLGDFGAKYPEIQVEVVKLDQDDLDQKLTTTLVGGVAAPDMVDLPELYMGKYAAQGGFVNLLDEPYNIGRYQQDLPEFAWNAGYLLDKSKFCFVDYSGAPGVIHYRRSLFDGAGLPSDPDEVRKLLCPEWETYLATGEKIAKESGPWFLDNATEVWFQYRNQNCFSFVDEQGKLNIVNDEHLRAVTLAKQAREKGLDAKLSLWTPEWENSFKDSKVATYLSGDWLHGLIKLYAGEATKGDWGMVPLPKKTGTPLTGSTLCIPEQAAHKEEAWKYIEYFSFTVKPQVQMYVLTFCFPNYKPSWDDPAFAQPVEWYGGQPAGLISVEVAKQFYNRPVVSAYHRLIMDIVSNEVLNVLDKDKDPEQALKDAEATAKEQFDL